MVCNMRGKLLAALIGLLSLNIFAQYVSDIPVIRIYAYKNDQPYAAGNGFFINKKGYISTCYHIVEGADSIFAVDYRMNVYPVTHICGYDRLYDIIIMKSKTNIFSNTFNMDAPVPLMGDSLFVIGISPELPGMTKQGVLMNIRDLGEMKSVFQINTRIEEGFSGSPVTDTAGSLVGMVCYRGYEVRHIISDTSFKIIDNEFTIAVPLNKILKINISNQTDFEYWQWLK